jgi:sulfate/thiosulfate transport system permease protein
MEATMLCLLVRLLTSHPLLWQVFWNVTLPNIRWGLMYGIILTNAVSSRLAHSESWLLLANGLSLGLQVGLQIDNAAMALQRAMGEFGAVSVISGNIIGRTQTLTLYVEGAYKVHMRSMQHAHHLRQSLTSMRSLAVKQQACRRGAYAV